MLGAAEVVGVVADLEDDKVLGRVQDRARSRPLYDLVALFTGKRLRQPIVSMQSMHSCHSMMWQEHNMRLEWTSQK